MAAAAGPATHAAPRFGAPLHVAPRGHRVETRVLMVSTEPDDEVVALAAGIWVRAKARRDGEAEPGDPAAAVPGLRRRLALPGAVLLGTSRDDRLVGFAVCAPRETTLELFYLAVDPGSWGGGVGTHLLAAVEEHARSVGRDCLELWVISDNARAIAVYERAGWEPTEELVRDATSGRVERRFVRRRSSGSRRTRP